MPTSLPFNYCPYCGHNLHGSQYSYWPGGTSNIGAAGGGGNMGGMVGRSPDEKK